MSNGGTGFPTRPDHALRARGENLRRLRCSSSLLRHICSRLGSACQPRRCGRQGFAPFDPFRSSRSHSGSTPPLRRAMMPTSAAPDQECDPYADRRVYPRVPVALPAFLQANGERHAVQILDLSPGGARLDCQASLPVGTAVTLDCGTLRRAAAVRWSRDGATGVCFESELDAREASALIERSEAMVAWMKKRQ
jgi:hypothetical protein